MMPLRRRFWAEVGFAIVSAMLLILTAGWPDWIEQVFGVDPDTGSGALEWATAIVLVISAAAAPALARAEWRHARERLTSTTDEVRDV